MAATADEVHGVGTSWVLMRVARSLQRPRQHQYVDAMTVADMYPQQSASVSGRGDNIIFCYERRR